MKLSSTGAKSHALSDQHHGWSSIVQRRPRLQNFDAWVRRCRVRGPKAFRTAMNAVYREISSLGQRDQVIAACHLGRLLDDQADMQEARR